MDKSENSDGQRGFSEKLVSARVSSALERLGPGHDVPWLARKTAIASSTLYDNLKRGISKTDQAVKIAQALDVSLDWLLAGEQSTKGKRATAPVQPDRDGAISDLGLKMIPEVDIAYSMGGGSLVGDHIDSRTVPFRRDWLERLTRGFKADVFLTRGEGDSMMPTILDDDDVLVNRADNVIRHQDRIWAIGYGELGMIKRVRRLPSGQFQLNSDNPAVSPIEATEDELYIVGRVIWIGRRV